MNPTTPFGSHPQRTVASPLFHQTILLSVLTSLLLLGASRAHAQISPNSATEAANTAPAYLGVNAPNEEQSPFTPNNTGVQSSQMVPSLSSPFINWMTPPESTALKNGIPPKVSKLLKQKEYSEALSEIDSYLKNNPKNVQLRFMRARTLITLGQLEQARLELVDLTEKFPELPEPYNNLAALYASAGKLEAAKDNLEMAVKLAPKNATAILNLADIYTRLAADHYKKAYELNRRLSDAPRKQKLAEEITK